MVLVKFLLSNFRILVSIRVGWVASHWMLQEADIQFPGRDRARNAVLDYSRHNFSIIFRAMCILRWMLCLGNDEVVSFCLNPQAKNMPIL